MVENTEDRFSRDEAHFILDQHIETETLTRISVTPTGLEMISFNFIAIGGNNVVIGIK